jgi:NADPH:quinone reductase-like Zn-dependent oxidoreductase
MKASQINQYGGPEVVELNESAPTPSPKNGQVLVEIYAAALNPFDWKLRSGYMKKMIPLQFPVTLGGDFSGRVTQVGEGVTDYAAGDEVFGTALVLTGGSGAFAESATASTSNITRKPKKVDHTEAASLVLVGVSSLQVLEQHMNLKSGQKILIHGGAGGIGSAAIQLAKSKGAYVAATASEESKEFVKNLGADEVIDYKNEKFEEKLHDFDAVFDTVGGEIMDRSFSVLKKGGVFVSMLGQPNAEKAKEMGITTIGQSTATNAANLFRLVELIEQSIIKPQIDKTFPLVQTKEAFTHLETGHPRGKVVLKVRE